MCSRANSAQAFEFPMLNDQSSFSTEREYHSSCTAIRGTSEKLVHLQAGRARDLEIATSTLLGRNPIKRPESAIGIRLR